MLPTQKCTRFNLAWPQSLGSVSRDMDQVFDQFFGRRAVVERDGGPWHAPLSLWEEEGRLRLEMDLPGVAKDDVELTVEDGRLTVRAQRKASDEQREYWYHQRRFGQVERTVSLPDFADPQAIEAELADGVLSISIGRKPEAEPKRIDVKTR